MAIEKHLEAQGPFSFTSNGGEDGLVTVGTVGSLKVKQNVVITAIGLPSLPLQIKRVLSPTQLIVGPVVDKTYPSKPKNNLKSRTDISAYTVALSANIRASEQPKPVLLKAAEVGSLVYEHEPTVAIRTYEVDRWGRPWDTTNPFPVKLSQGNIEIGSVNGELEVQLSHQNDVPDLGDVADSVQRGDGINIEKVDRLSTGNSTATPLISSGTFIGAWEEVLGWSTITILINTDQASISNGLIMEFSSNGVDIDDTDEYTIGAGDSKVYSVGVTSRYFRVRYINGVSAQGHLRIQTIYHVSPPKPSSHRIDNPISTQDDAELVKSIITGKNPFDVFNNIRSTYGGAMHTSLNDWQTDSQAFISPGGAINQSKIVRLVGDNFIAGAPLLSNIWVSGNTGSGSSSTATGDLVLSTGATPNSSTWVQSLRKSRFINKTHNMSQQSIATPNWAAGDVVRRWGAYNPADGSLDGFYFENNSGNISVVIIKNNAISITIPENSFNGQNTFIKDDNIHIYEIIYTNTEVYFFQDRKIIHSITQTTSSLTGTPHLKVAHYVENINGNTVNNSLLTAGASISRIGAGHAQPHSFFISGSSTTLIKNTPGRIHSLFVSDQGTGATNIVVYNNTAAAGEVIANIDTSDIIGNFSLNAEFDIGLTIVTNGGGTIKVTVMYD